MLLNIEWSLTLRFFIFRFGTHFSSLIFLRVAMHMHMSSVLVDNQVHARNTIKISKKFQNTKIEFLFKMNSKQLFEWKLYRKLDIIRFLEIKVTIEEKDCELSGRMGSSFVVC